MKITHTVSNETSWQTGKWWY